MHREPFSTLLPAKLWNTANSVQTLDDPERNKENRVKFFTFNGPAYKRDGSHGEDAPMNLLYWSDTRTRTGIVAWMFEGLFDLMNEGPVAEPQAEKEARMNEADPERALFIERVRLTGDPSSFVSSADMVDLIWPNCPDQRAATMRLSKRMRMLFGLEQTRARVDGKHVRGYNGIAIMES
jgi:hypothetical protein